MLECVHACTHTCTHMDAYTTTCTPHDIVHNVTTAMLPRYMQGFAESLQQECSKPAETKQSEIAVVHGYPTSSK